MPRTAVQVYLRARPCDAAASAGNPNVSYLPDKKTVVVSIPKDAKAFAAQGTAGNQYQFKFDGVLHEASQEEVFETVAADVLRSALDGFNGTVMCYGQTGAGKTYTMSGGRQSFRQRGIIPRVLTQLFGEARARAAQQDVSVSVSYLEIYNELLYDLLDITTQPHEISVQDTTSASRGAGAGIKVAGLRTVAVHSEAEAMKLLFEGESNRVIGEHQLNRESSRSHSIFQLTIESRPKDDPTGVMTVSKLSLVDLAGSERVSKTRSDGNVLREAGHINKSLSILEQVILALGDKGRDHVPFRSSKLTHVLKDSLGGNCATVLVANVWGEPDQTDETLSTCRFAQRMMRLTCDVTPNVVEDSSAKVRQMQRQVQELQQELALHDAMAGRQGVAYAPYSAQQRAALQAQVEQWLGGEDLESIEPLELVSLRHVREVLLCCKQKVRAALADAAQRAQHAQHAQQRLALAGAGAAPSAAAASAAAAAPSDEPPLSPTSAMVARLAAPEAAGAAAGGVGAAAPRPSQAGEAGEGVAASTSGQGAPHAPHPPAGSRPPSGGAGGGSRRVSGANVPAAAAAVVDGQVPGASGPGRPGGGPPPDKQAAFNEFKSGPGAGKLQLLEENRGKLRAAKKKAKELGLGVNGAKRRIDELKSRSDQLKAARQAKGGDAAQTLDAEELEVLESIKAAKKAYKEQYGELQFVRSEVDYTQQLCDTCSKEIMADFQQWYRDAHGVTLSGPSAGGGLPPSLLHAEPSSLSAAAMQDPEGLLPPESSPASPSAASTAPSSYAPSHHHHQHHPHQQLAPLAGPHAPRHPSPPGMPMPSSGPGPRGAHAAAAAAATPAKAVGAASRTGGGGAGAGVLRAAPPPPLPVPPPLHGPPGLLGTPGARAGQLPSLGVLPEPGELSDPEALAFYQAQKAMLARTQGVAHRPGSGKKAVGAKTTFSHTNRADITAKIAPDVFVKPGAARRPAQQPS